MSIDSRSLNYINEEYLPSYLSESLRNEILPDFPKYAKEFTNTDLLENFMYKLNDEVMSGLLGKLITANSEDISALSTDIRENLIRKFLTTPIYKKDAGGKISIEGICEGYGITLPTAEYSSVIDLAMTFMRGHYRGDENFGADAPELKLVKYAMYSAIWFLQDFELFEKLNGLDSSIQIVDFSSSLDALFKEGKLDVAQNGLIMSVLGIKLISDILPFPLGGNVYALLSLADSYLKNNDILGIDFAPYIDAENGCILLGDLIDDVAFEKAADDLLRDKGPADNDVTLYLNGKYRKH
jgi:hypothetical protein